MSSCSCQHLLIACNSSLRLTAGAVGLGPAPPAIGCTQRGSLARARASLTPSPHLRLTNSPKASPDKTRSSLARPVPLLLSMGNLWWGLCGGGHLPSRPPPQRVLRGWEKANEKGTRQGCEEGRMVKAVPAAPAGHGAVWAVTTQSFYSWVLACFDCRSKQEQRCPQIYELAPK